MRLAVAHLSLVQLGGISDRAVRQWIASGKLEAERNGRSWRIPASAVQNGSESEEDCSRTAQMQAEIDRLHSELAEKNRKIAASSGSSSPSTNTLKSGVSRICSSAGSVMSVDLSRFFA